MTIRICTNARVIESAFRYNTALGIDDLLRAYTYESVYDGDAEICPVAVIRRRKVFESARQNVVGGGSGARRAERLDRSGKRAFCLAFGFRARLRSIDRYSR
jgi:hypothetical protein